MVSGDNHAGCFRAAGEGEFGLIAWVYSWVFLILTTVLILNMLIAMMVRVRRPYWRCSALPHSFEMAKAISQALPPSAPLAAQRA